MLASRPLMITLLAVASCAVAKGQETTWSLSQVIERDDNSVIWTAPTAIDTSVLRHDFSYEITGISAFFGSIMPSDETSQYAAANALSGAGAVIGYPGELWSQTLVELETETEFDLTATVGSDGIGRVTFTNITLGEFPPVFNPNPILIQALKIEATITLTESNILPGDYNNNGVVDLSDYSVWSAFYGSTTILLADGNADGVVDAADYTVWRDNFTPTAAVSIPEPMALALAALGCASLIGRGRLVD